MSTSTSPPVSLPLWAAIAALLFGIAYAGAHFGGDGLLYIAHGRFMLEHGALPEVDPFSQSSMHAPLVLHLVLSMLGFAVVDEVLGVAWLVPLTALAVMAALLGMVRLAGGRVLPTLASVLLVIVLIVVDKELFEVRGQAFAYAPFVVFVVLLERILTAELPHARRALLWAFPLVALWANLHPSFVLAIAMPLLCLLGLIVERPRDRGRAPLLAALAVASVLGSFVSPYGPRLLLDVLSLLADPTTSQIAHMRSPPASPQFLAWLALSLLIVGAYAVHGPRPLRRTRALVAAALIIATLMSRRYVVFATCFEIVLLGALLEHLAMRADRVRADRARVDVARLVSALERRGARLAIGAVAFVAGALLVQRGPEDLYADQPDEALVVLESARLPDRVLTEFAWAGALMRAWGETRQLHIDGRNNLYANGVFEDYLRFVFDVDASLPLLDVYEINTVLWPAPWPLNGALARSGAWREVYRDEKAVLWVRRAAELD